MKRALEHPLRTLVSAAFVTRAAVRVWWYEPRSNLPELVSRLKATPPARVELDANLADAIVEHLLPFLPPWGAGRCVKRSLLQLDLWSRAGLSPRFHLGLLTDSPAHAGHVWVTTDGSIPDGITETWTS